MIKCRLESVTFGRIVSKYVSIPESMFAAYDNDSELYKAVKSFVLSESGYMPHVNETFVLDIKA